MKLRVKFKKYGPVRFIGHLDVMRFFQKAIRRAEIDVAYAMSEESKELHCLDYAMLYCKLGENEKSAESFRVALERFESTDKPSLKKHLKKVRRMLDEAGIDYT